MEGDPIFVLLVLLAFCMHNISESEYKGCKKRERWRAPTKGVQRVSKYGKLEELSGEEKKNANGKPIGSLALSHTPYGVL